MSVFSLRAWHGLGSLLGFGFLAKSFKCQCLSCQHYLFFSHVLKHVCIVTMTRKSNIIIITEKYCYWFSLGRLPLKVRKGARKHTFCEPAPGASRTAAPTCKRKIMLSTRSTSCDVFVKKY
jgi:hypothetical protein